MFLLGEKNENRLGIEAQHLSQRLCKITGFIFAYHCKMGWQTIPDEVNEPTDLIRLRILDPEMDWTTKILSTCLTISLGTLHVISIKPKIWQNLLGKLAQDFMNR